MGNIAQRVLLLILPCVMFFSIEYNALAADKYGQAVNPALETAVSVARKKRLPYLKESYDPEASVRQLERIVRRAPNYFRAWFNLGLAYHQTGNYPKSRSAFNKAIQIRNRLKLKDSSVVNSAGWVAMKNGDFARAKKLLHLAEKETKGQRNFTAGAVISNLGELYYLLQDFDRAQRYLSRAKSEYNNENAAYYLSRIKRVRKKLSY